MAKVFDFKKQRTFIKIYGVAQVVLIGLLVYMAVHFQAALQQRFISSVVATLVIQLALFYPIYRYAVREATREIETCAVGLTDDELKKFRTKRMIADTCKWAYFIFFAAFAYKAPKVPFILSIIVFSFLLTSLTYLQCYNFVAKRLMKEKS
jgi:hypothetical protein